MGLLQPHERHGRRARQARLSRPGRPKAIVVHSLAQARSALAAAASLGVDVTLLSGPGAASYAGPSWFIEVVRLARSVHPGVSVAAVLDCADQPGRALAGLRLGVKQLRLAGHPRARAGVEAIAKAQGAVLDDRRYDMLDLAAVADAQAAATAFLEDERVSHPSRRAVGPPQDDAISSAIYKQPRHPEERAQASVSKGEGRRTRP